MPASNPEAMLILDEAHYAHRADSLCQGRSVQALHHTHDSHAPIPLAAGSNAPYVLHCIYCAAQSKGKTVAKIIRNTGIGEFFGMMGSAINTAAALEKGRRPDARDLRRLGIDPMCFNGTI